MSTNLNYKQVANVTRRTWDTETYEKKAKARQQAADSVEPRRTDHVSAASQDDKEEFLPAEKGAAGPEGSQRAFLKARKGKVYIDSKVGDKEIVSAEAATLVRTAEGDIRDGVVKTGVGWHCRICDCFLKDSHTYLDHINGKKHQRKLGYSMRVERSSKDDLMTRLNQLTKKREEESSTQERDQLDYHELVKAKDEEERLRKEERRRKRLERKNRANDVGPEREDQEQEGDDGEEDELEAEVDPAMAAMMGFSGFGGGSRNR